jgi:cyclophilin family peptidyl-prolyl cis-trans isomerase
MTRPLSRIEPLEARIALALAVQNPLLDFLAGGGKTSASIDLSKMFDTDPEATSRTRVNFVTNVDIDASTPGLQAGVIELELFDDLTPLTVQNFLSYVNARSARGDYDNTIIHRTANFLGSSAADFIQGGGFEFPRLGSHIPTGLNLINEFNDTLSNVRGTIAMGKLGGDPDSASSEWFINANDNSGIFDRAGSGSAQGYTVFGRVLSGIEIVDTITLATTRNLTGSSPGIPAINGAFSAVPLQGGYTSGTPTADQYFRITDAFVVPGDSTGITYSATVAPVGGAPANLLKTSVSGSKLNLTFSGQSGEADVTVTGRNAQGETASDTFRVTLGANLAARVVTSGTQSIFQTINGQQVRIPILDDGFETLLVPGDVGKFTIRVSNAGSATFAGQVKVDYYLSQATGTDPDGTLFDGSDRLIHTLPAKSLRLGAGASTNVAATFDIPPELTTSETGTYRLLAKVTPLGGAGQLADLTDDDVARLSGQHALFNRAGDFDVNFTINAQGQYQFDGAAGTAVTGVREKPAVLKYVQDDGDAATVDPVVSVQLRGPGFASVRAEGGGYDLSASGTTLASTLSATIASREVRVAFRDIGISSPISTVALDNADVSDLAAFSGGARRIQLGNLTGPGALLVGALLPDNTARVAISLGRVSDYAFESAMPVASLQAVEWLDTDGREEVLNFTTLGKLSITGARGVARGDLQSSVQVFGSARVDSFSVTGFFQAAAFSTNGDIGAITLGGIDRGIIAAGDVTPVQTAGQTTDGDIASFRIVGIRGYTDDLFIHSLVLAEKFGSIVVQRVDDAGPTTRGFVADAIKSYNRIGGPKLRNLDDPVALNPDGQADKVGNYVVGIV